MDGLPSGARSFIHWTAGHDLILRASLWLFDDKEFDDLVWSTAFRFLIKVVKTYIWNWTICTWIINDQVCSEFFIVKPRTNLRQTNWRTIGTISIPQTNSLSWTPKLTEDGHKNCTARPNFHCNCCRRTCGVETTPSKWNLFFISLQPLLHFFCCSVPHLDCFPFVMDLLYFVKKIS